MLELNQVSAGYDGINVIENAMLRTEPGTITTIVGRNGCGKSTLLKCCAGLLQTNSGDVLLDGIALAQYSPSERAKQISYLSQSRNVPSITVERLVMHGRHPHLDHKKKPRLEDWEKIDQAMERMQISDFRHKSVQSLSGGERQRVYLAMLLAQDSPILLLDEPTTYLDMEHQLALLNLLSELKQEGKTVLMILHDLEQALRCSDRIVAMDHGQILQIGTPEELLASGVLDRIFHVQIRCIEVEGESVFLFGKQNSPAISARL